MRTFEESHPWINFKIDLSKLGFRTWMLLGEAESKCSHVAGAPLQPDVARRLHQIYLSKGVHGTASIEGNTLSEDEVLQRIRGELALPPSKEYLGREIDNIVEGCNSILWDVHENNDLSLTPERIMEFNRLVLRDLDHEEDVTPGEIRKHQVGVLRYRGAPAEDCDYLLKRMCQWLEEEVVIDDPQLDYCIAVIRAIMAHLYIAWIHPFGDGNGRTARLIEFQLLVRASIPFPAAHLLSDHYNRTRAAYYRVLDRTSREPYPVEQFIQYAMEGFVDELRSQLVDIRTQQMAVTWEHYVHSFFAGQETKARIRQRHLALALPPDVITPVSKIRSLTPRLAMEYADKQTKTITRDINALINDGLIHRGARGVTPARGIVQAFLPGRAPLPERAPTPARGGRRSSRAE